MYAARDRDKPKRLSSGSGSGLGPVGMFRGTFLRWRRYVKLAREAWEEHFRELKGSNTGAFSVKFVLLSLLGSVFILATIGLVLRGKHDHRRHQYQADDAGSPWFSGVRRRLTSGVGNRGAEGGEGSTVYSFWPSEIEAAKVLANRIRAFPSFASQPPGAPIGMCTQVLLFRDTKSNGFGAQVLRMLDAYALARATRFTFLIEMGNHWNYGCGKRKGWECYFDMPLQACMRPDGTEPARTMPSYPIAAELQRKFGGGSACAPLQDFPRLDRNRAEECLLVAQERSTQLANLVVQSTLLDAQGALDMYRALASDFWQPRALISKVLDKDLKRLGVLEEDAPCIIGVHIRRGDKYKEVPFVDLSTYASAVRIAAAHTGCSQVFVASDELASIRTLERELGGMTLLSIAGEERVGHDQQVANREAKFDRSVHTLELLLELKVLAASRIFIGTFSSNFARLVHVLRGQPANTTWSLDTAWHQPGTAYRSFGTQYCVDDELASHVLCSHAGAAVAA
ncbi:hypothetical protein FVE85_6095 [Porphyridium purpureum]|uniref:Alpha-(1,6)-fucosyltransferase n=1 Tax=Porphyridium purpureum TaxID=35688 RepID=A0A5J4Z5J3_PORPP|nr:hypothetical protein FVE85_6095 [Porphyridium purpureum]|eukprot:POR3389..scf295_1